MYISMLKEKKQPARLLWDFKSDISSRLSCTVRDYSQVAEDFAQSININGACRF